MRRLPPVLLVPLIVLAIVLVACGGDDGDDDLSGERRLEATTTTEAGSTEPPGGGAPPVQLGEMRLAEVAAVAAPTALAVDPSTGDLYVTSQPGQVHRIDPETQATEEVLDISSTVSSGNERGLLGLAFDPPGDHLYLSYTNRDGDTRIDEYAWRDGEVVTASKREILAQEQPYANHNGGQITFGPDGYLYVGLGDGGSGGDPHRTGQDPSDLLGSILRIDPTTPGDGAAYAIPADNPFADGADGRPEVWLYGVRNPWRFSFDRETGDLWVGDVGQNQVEEITFLPASDGAEAGRGANLGWNLMEGNRQFDGDAPPEGHVAPIHTYGREGGNCSVTGGYVYRGSALPGLEGAYLYGDFCAGELRFLRIDDGTIVSDESLGLAVGPNNLASFGEDADGELYVLALGDGKVYRLEPA